MNQYVFFGNESNVDEIIICAKKFPMMGDRQLIIVKDGNKIFKNLKKITSTIQSIPKSTVLVFNLNGVKIDSKKEEINSNSAIIEDITLDKKKQVLLNYFHFYLFFHYIRKLALDSYNEIEL